MRRILLLLILVSLGWGIWLGEDLHIFLGLSSIGMVGVVVLLVAGAVLPRGWLRRTGLVLGVLAAIVGGFFIGGRGAGAAFNACVRSGEGVRQALAEHRDRTGSFPAKLGDVNQPLPGGRLLRGSLLEYERTGQGYELVFSDYWVTHRATDTEQFNATK